MKNSILVSFLALTSVSCATRAPSTFELDKKAGLTPTLDVEGAKKEAKELKKDQEKKDEKKAKEKPDQPWRTRPRIEKIWVYGQELSPSVYLQGTHLFLEVNPGEWIRGERGAQ
jgi:hypothetical protein